MTAATPVFAMNYTIGQTEMDNTMVNATINQSWLPYTLVLSTGIAFYLWLMTIARYSSLSIYITNRKYANLIGISSATSTCQLNQLTKSMRYTSIVSSSAFQLPIVIALGILHSPVIIGTLTYVINPAYGLHGIGETKYYGMFNVLFLLVSSLMAMCSTIQLAALIKGNQHEKADYIRAFICLSIAFIDCIWSVIFGSSFIVALLIPLSTALAVAVDQEFAHRLLKDARKIWSE